MADYAFNVVHHTCIYKEKHTYIAPNYHKIHIYIIELVAMYIVG